MVNGLMNKSCDCQSPFAGFPLKPIKQLRGTGEIDLGTLASGHDREKQRRGAAGNAEQEANPELLDKKCRISIT